MRTTKRKSASGLVQAVAVAALVMTAGVAGNAVGNYVNNPPVVGHIVSFETSALVGTRGDHRLVVHRQDQSSCALELNVIRRLGGSFVLESQIGDAGDFRVHWAGAHTSNDSEDCGSDADLNVARDDLDLLASAAGGYGAGQARAPVLAFSIGRTFDRMFHSNRPE